MADSNIRYTRVSDIICLIKLMCRPWGVTLQEIQEEFSVSRRTAERMRDCLLVIFPEIDIIETDDNQRHWGFVDCTLEDIFHMHKKSSIVMFS